MSTETSKINGQNRLTLRKEISSGFEEERKYLKYLTFIGKGLIYFVFIAITVLCVLPFVWMLSTSLKETYFLFTYPPQLIPKNPILSNYLYIFKKTDFFMWFRNSTIVTLVTVLFCLFFSSLAGYTFAKMRFLGREILFILILACLMIPVHAIIIPEFIIMGKLNLLDTYLALIIPGWANAFGIFLMREYIKTIPNVLIDAAKIDGCSEIGIFAKVVFPLCKPALTALAIFTFLGSWNNFIWPLILTTTSKTRTLPVALAMFQGQYSTQWGQVMATACCSFMPVLLLFILLQKYFVQGIALTGLKG